MPDWAGGGGESSRIESLGGREGEPLGAPEYSHTGEECLSWVRGEDIGRRSSKATDRDGTNAWRSQIRILRLKVGMVL